MNKQFIRQFMLQKRFFLEWVWWKEKILKINKLKVVISFLILHFCISLLVHSPFILVVLRQKVNKTFRKVDFLLNLMSRVAHEVEEIKTNQDYHNDRNCGIFIFKPIIFSLKFAVHQLSHMFHQGEDELILQQNNVIKVLNKCPVLWNCL